jgi:hypothetical protein
MVLTDQAKELKTFMSLQAEKRIHVRAGYRTASQML